MNHLGTKVIETERLILRKFTMNDAENVLKNWASDDEVTKYLAWPTHKSIEDTKAFIGGVIEQYKSDRTYEWIIEYKENREVIGSIGVVSSYDEIGSAHIGYCIGRNWWHKGITTEAFKAVIKFLMCEVKVNRVESRHDVNNPNSGKVMEKCGLKFEGTLRQSDKNNQGICDTSWYSILNSEFFK